MRNYEKQASQNGGGGGGGDQINNITSAKRVTLNACMCV